MESLHNYGMKEKILFATRIGDEEWKEELITDNEENIEAATNWAIKNGFDRIRIAEIDLSIIPDFTKVLK
jgi:hypothetical protein